MLRLPFELFLALRYLRPKRTFVSVITLISVIGVTLGVAVLIIVISVMSGFDQQLRDKIFGFKAHLRVLKIDSSLTNYEAAMRSVRSNRNVKGVAPFILGQVFVKTQPADGAARVGAPLVRGIDPRFETNVSTLCSNLVVGQLDLEGNSVIIGIEFAQALRLRVGDRLAIYSPHNLQEMEKSRGQKDEVAILPEDYTVRGIFDAGYYEYNATVILTSLENAQDLFLTNASEHQQMAEHGLLVMLHDPYKAEEVRLQLRQALGPAYQISSWTEENSQILTALLVEKNVMFFLLAFILIVAAFGIMSSQITFVVQKTREIGMLKGLGATPSQILWLFLSQSLVVGVVGVLAGFGLGRLALAYRNEFLEFLRRSTGLEIFPASVYGFTQLPALIAPWDIALICGSALVICALAGLIPAWNAGRLRAVEALRYE